MAMHSIMVTQTATQEKTKVEEIYAYLILSPSISYSDSNSVVIISMTFRAAS